MQLTSFKSLLVATSVGIGALLCAAGNADGAVVTQTFSSSPGAMVPDNDLSGLADTISVTTAMTSVDKVTVTLETTGGWTGDLYAYLLHDGTMSVLLNRTSKTAATPAGSSASGVTLTLDDAAASDIHDVSAATSPIVGSFQPDGRNVSPLTADDTSARTTSLADYIGATPAGDWSLFIADVAAGDEATLVSWSVSLTGDVIPEPSIGILGALGLTVAFRRRR